MRHTDTPAADLCYCPRCGMQEFQRVKPKKLQCKACGFELYLNASAAVCALISDDRDRLLVTVRAHQPARGQLDLPGGFVDPGETAEQAVTREIREELGLDVQQLGYFCSEANPCYPYGGMHYHTLDLAFTCQVQTPTQAQAADDVQAVRFLPLEKVRPQDFAFLSIQRIVQRFREASLQNG